MLRDDTLKTTRTAIAKGEAVVPTPDTVRALQREARQLRAQALHDLFRKSFTWLFRHRGLVLPAGRIDVVRGH